MSIFKIKRIKKNGIYYASNEDLKIRDSQGNIIPGGHSVIVTSVNKQKGTCRIKTITSLEEKRDGKIRFKPDKLKKVRDGDILVIPKKQLNSRHLSGVSHDSKTIKSSKLTKSKSSMKYPKRYDKLIHKK